MSKPRPVFSNRTLLITRRCIGRTSLFTGDSEAPNIFKYFLALAATRFDIEIHAFVLMSNHYHLVLTDRHGRHPAFTCWLNGMVARFVNRALGREDSLWDGRQVNVVDLLDADAVARKTAYVITNPARARMKPKRAVVGSFLNYEDGASRIATSRPTVLASCRTNWPESAELQIGRPTSGPVTGLKLDLEVLVAHYVKGTQSLVDTMSVKQLPATDESLSVSGRDRPGMWAGTSANGGGLTPRVASSDPMARKDYMSMIRRFERLHRAARLATTDKVEAAGFPPGTYRGQGHGSDALVSYSLPTTAPAGHLPETFCVEATEHAHPTAEPGAIQPTVITNETISVALKK